MEKADIVPEAQFIAALFDPQRSRIIRHVEAVGFLRGVRSLATLLVALSLVANGEDVKSWGNLYRVAAGQAIEIRKITGGSVRGNYATYSGQSIDLSVNQQLVSIPRVQISDPAPSQNAKGYVDRLSGRSRSGSCVESCALPSQRLEVSRTMLFSSRVRSPSLVACIFCKVSAHACTMYSLPRW